jgi:hypothetical protein
MAYVIHTVPDSMIEIMENQQCCRFANARTCIAILTRGGYMGRFAYLHQEAGDPPITMARAHLVDPAVTRWYHCVTRCVRRAFLLSEGPLDRRERIDRRLEELAQIFAISVGGFSVMHNHFAK